MARGYFWSGVILCKAEHAFGEIREDEVVSSRIQPRGFEDLVHSLSIISHTAKRGFRRPIMLLSAYDPVDRRKNVRKLGNPIPSPVIVPASLNATWRHGGFCLMILARGEISESVISYLDRVDGRTPGFRSPQLLRSCGFVQTGHAQVGGYRVRIIQ